ncbi:hypothetical protein NM688_g8062 [Phlebia brevispora]|uniref:Uncharacterized protein n=1 Tax=Phlebia brevispora TaxID=194682 RepID=A0ACC1RY85_9APHY|nr:hypothetical protein NM688_g8062 [Phlebia brevispora]
MTAEPLADPKLLAEYLKTEGNTFHTSGRYKEAYQKYSDAIAHDGENAVLYANRAASSLALKEYLNAASDAQKAVTINADYAKAWARLGTATQVLSLFDLSINAWESALKCLPEDATKCTPMEARLKEQCCDGLKTAKRDKKKISEDLEDGRNFVAVSMTNASSLPWQRALSMANEMRNSSGWVILNAYRVRIRLRVAEKGGPNMHQEFSRGVEAMKATKVMADGRIEGRATAIVDISNGILRDPRVFHADSPDWFERFDIQLRAEADCYGAWVSCGSDEVIKKSLELQRNEGWQAVRRALSLTVRALIMRAFIVWGSMEEHVPALEYYKSAITILEWGLHTWANVPNSERGAIFTDTFVRGVRRLYIEVYLAVPFPLLRLWRPHGMIRLTRLMCVLGQACKKLGPDSEYSLDILEDLAQKMLDETQAHMPSGREDWMQDAGFFLSFFVYPTADAHATLGFVNMQRAMRSKDDVELALDYFAESAEYYMKAGMAYPEDDEKRIFYLRIAFEARWHRGDSLSDVLPMCQLVRETDPKVAKIWEYSALSPTRQAYVRGLRQFELEAYARILQGSYTLDTPSTVSARLQPAIALY